VLTTGSLLGDFRIEGELGRGGMGVVYRATQLSLGRPVALKVIASGLAGEEGFRDRFGRESRLAASLDHPNVIPVYAAGEHDGVLYIAMRYVEGTDLRALIRREVRLDPLLSAGVVAQVASALDAAHERGLVHRDVKPANVLVAARGGGEHAYLTDFGLTKRSASESSLTAVGEWVGTLDYVAPEQVRGDAVDGRADVYALGCVLYEMLTGRVPFPREDDLAKLWAHISDDAPSALELAPDTPPALAAVAERAMAKDRADRFAEAGMMGRVALAAVPGGADTGARARAAAAALSAPPSPGAGAPTQAARTRRVRFTRVARGADTPGRTGRLAVLAGAFLVAACATTAVGLALEDEPSTPRGAPVERPGRASAAGRVVGAPIRVGDAPSGVAATADAVWVANTGDETVTRIDARTGRRQAPPIPVGEDPRAIAATEGAVWVGNFGDGTVSRIDARTNRPAPPIPVGAGPTDIVAGAGRVWVATEDDQVVPLDPGTGRPAGAPLRVKSNGSLALGGGRLWVSDRNDGTVRSIDTVTGGAVDTPLAIGALPADIAVGRRFIWVTLADDGAVRRVDLRADRSGSRTVQLGGRPALLARGGSAVWVTDADREAVLRLSAGTAKPVGQALAVGEDPAGLAIGRGGVWVTSAADDTVTRIVPR
jgi:DNA-binding beta-propeller fold protein YncE/predicted Ser/Thr protein kinase